MAAAAMGSCDARAFPISDKGKPAANTARQTNMDSRLLIMPGILAPMRRTRQGRGAADTQ